LSDSLQQWQQIEDLDGIGQCLNELGMTHLALEDHQRSEECLLEAGIFHYGSKTKGSKQAL